MKAHFLFFQLFRQHRVLRPRLWLPPPGPVSWGKPPSHTSWRVPEPLTRVSQRVVFPSPWTASLSPSLHRSPSAAGILDAAAQSNQSFSVGTRQCPPCTSPKEATQHTDVTLSWRWIQSAVWTLSLPVWQLVRRRETPHTAISPFHTHFTHAPDKWGGLCCPLCSQWESWCPFQSTATARKEKQTQ